MPTGKTRQDSNKEVAARLRIFAATKYGTKRGAGKAFAEALGVSPQQAGNLLSGRSGVGISTQTRLQALGCDLAWLMFGEKEEERVRYDVILEECKKLIRERGIVTVEELREFFSERDRLARILGPSAYKTLAEAGLVQEQKAGYRASRVPSTRRKK